MFANFQSANPNKDFELPDMQEEGLSKIKFSPNANYLAACFWDNLVCVLCVCVRGACARGQGRSKLLVIRVWQVGVSCK